MPNHITVQDESTATDIPVRVLFEGGHITIGGRDILKARILRRMTPYQKLRYDFGQNQLNHDLEEC